MPNVRQALSGTLGYGQLHAGSSSFADTRSILLTSGAEALVDRSSRRQFRLTVLLL
jgi:hypothetical protein